MEHQRTRLKQTLTVDKLISLLYYEFAINHVFEGEQHDFWECVYVDKGEVDVTADSEHHLLKPGMIIFHKPNEFHSFYACNGTAPNIIVFSFECKSHAMKRFERKIICLNDEERNLLANVVKEGKHAFEFPSQVPLIRRRDADTGSEQLIRLYLETFFIRLLKKVTLSHQKLNHSYLSTVSKEIYDQGFAQTVIRFLQDNIDRSLSLTEISQSLHVAKTRLKDLFKRRTGETIMGYFTNMKIEHAKKLMREEPCNFTEIARRIGFSSPHHFSKTFKRTSGMTPSEYAKSVIALMNTK